MSIDRRDRQTATQAANAVLGRLSESWLSRAAVRNQDYSDESVSRFDPQFYDYPPGLIPFKSHPKYVVLDEPIQRKVQALAWIAWNRRVVDTEELVVCRALLSVMNGETDIKLTGASRMAIRQTLVDEAFHSHMHEVAARVPLRGRGMAIELFDRLCRPGYSYRSLIAASSRNCQAWELDIARFAWAVVGELSIYEFLTIVSNDESIHPGSRELLGLHESDEAAHASIIAQMMREHFKDFGKEQRVRFEEYLPQAINSLSQQDWLVWHDVLELAGVQDARMIIDDVENDPDIPQQLPLLRSHRRIESLCEELGIDLASTLQSR